MSRAFRRVLTFAVSAVTVVAAGPALSAAQAGADQKFAGINHIVVIYEENHSFDNLYGGWEGVNGRANATPGQMAQVRENGVAYTCLLQNDVNLSSPPQPSDCVDGTITSHFANQPFDIGAYISPSAQTCPQPGA